MGLLIALSGIVLSGTMAPHNDERHALTKWYWSTCISMALIDACKPSRNKRPPTRAQRVKIQRAIRSMLKANQPKHHKRKGTTRTMAIMSVIAMEAILNKAERQVIFDTDRATVGADNRCSACISHCIDDFIGPLTDCERTIRGFGGTSIHNVKHGTIQWKWEDDNGMVHNFTIPKSYYVPEGKVRLLSPQHWAQVQKEKDASETTTGSQTILQWHGKYPGRRTIKLGEKDNVATFSLGIRIR